MEIEGHVGTLEYAHGFENTTSLYVQLLLLTPPCTVPLPFPRRRPTLHADEEHALHLSSATGSQLFLQQSAQKPPTCTWSEPPTAAECSSTAWPSEKSPINQVVGRQYNHAVRQETTKSTKKNIELSKPFSPKKTSNRTTHRLQAPVAPSRSGGPLWWCQLPRVKGQHNSSSPPMFSNNHWVG